MASAFLSRNSRLRWLSVLAIGAGAAFASNARAEEPKGRTSSLSWVRLPGAESCIATQELALAVEERLKRKVFVSASDADVSVEGRIEKRAGKWRATLSVRDLDGKELGSRELESSEADCSALDEGLVFVVSILIDPTAGQNAAAAENPPKEKPQPPPKERPAKVIVRRERVLVPSPPPKPVHQWAIEAGAGAAFGFGLLPGVSSGIAAGALVEPPGSWALMLTGAYWFRKSVEADSGARGDVSLATIGAGVCPIGWSNTRLSYRLCAGVAAGVLRTSGVGFDTDETSEAPTFYVFVPNRFGVRIAGPLAALASVSPMAAIARRELTYRAADGATHSLFNPSPVAGVAEIGLALFFP